MKPVNTHANSYTNDSDTSATQTSQPTNDGAKRNNTIIDNSTDNETDKKNGK